MKENNLTSTFMENNNILCASGAITLNQEPINDSFISSANTFSSIITPTETDSFLKTGIIESFTTTDNSGNLYKKEFEVEVDVIDFIEKRNKSKEIIKKVLMEIYYLVSSKNKLTPPGYLRKIKLRTK